MEKKNCAVIGSGLGGLSAAIRLANRGIKVQVFEKNSFPGGKVSQIMEKGFRFDTGASLLTMPFVLEELFTDAGEKSENYLKLKRLDINCKYFYPDGTILNAFSNRDKLIEEIISRTSEKKENLIKLFKSSESVYDLTADLFLFNSVFDSKIFRNKKSLKTVLRINQLDLFKSMHKSNSELLQDKRIIQLFDRYATFNGSDPYCTPATLKVIQHVENGLGAWTCENGIYSITEALCKLAIKMGVVFHFNKNVESILYKKGRVTGIKTGNETINSEILISNGDINFTYRELLRDKSSLPAKIYNRLEPSSSAIVFYWGVRGIHPALEIHNILFSQDYKDEFNYIFQKKTVPDDPTIYIYISSKFNPNDAPGTSENWFVMTNAAYNNGQNWDKEIDKTRKCIIQKINDMLGIDISTKIVFEKIMSPPDFESRTNSTKGSIYGISSNSKFAAFFRHQNRSRKYKGLYFTGGSVHPGGGIPLVLLSGKITDRLIGRYELGKA
ncbi:MAG: 1-hydroxycarotenoid 3,4-desaturase CrtD [Ignavibacteria bacterium]